MGLRLSLLASLVFVIAPRFVTAQDTKRIDGEKVAKIASPLVAGISALADLPVKVTPDVSRAMGLIASERGGIIVPDSRLTDEALKKVDRDVLPIGYLFLRGITLSVADLAIATDQHRQITVTIEDKSVMVSVLPLAVTRVAGRLTLLAYTNRKEPAIVTTLVEYSEGKDLPLEIDARPVQDQRATVLLSILGRHRAALDVIAQD